MQYTRELQPSDSLTRCINFIWPRPPITILMMLAMGICNTGNATDISSVVRDNSGQPQRGDGGHVEIGMGYRAYSGVIYGYPESNIGGTGDDLAPLAGGSSDRFDSSLFINLNGYYQYRGFFVEFYSDFISNGSAGYSFFHTENWTFDTFLTETHGYLGIDTSDRWALLEERTDDIAVGLRGSYYGKRFTLQFSLLTDLEDTHNGNAATLFFGKNWQYRNWNFHSLLGFEYSSREINNYYFGVSEQESDINPQFETYMADAGVDLLGEIGVTYPISASWVFRSAYRLKAFSKTVSNSPLITDRVAPQLSSSISYVF